LGLATFAFSCVKRDDCGLVGLERVDVTDELTVSGAGTASSMGAEEGGGAATMYCFTTASTLSGRTKRPWFSLQ
jgi:hypothetical protein